MLFLITPAVWLKPLTEFLQALGPSGPGVMMALFANGQLKIGTYYKPVCSLTEGVNLGHPREDC